MNSGKDDKTEKEIAEQVEEENRKLMEKKKAMKAREKELKKEDRKLGIKSAEAKATRAPYAVAKKRRRRKNKQSRKSRKVNRRK